MIKRNNDTNDDTAPVRIITTPCTNQYPAHTVGFACIDINKALKWSDAVFVKTFFFYDSQQFSTENRCSPGVYLFHGIFYTSYFRFWEIMIWSELTRILVVLKTSQRCRPCNFFFRRLLLFNLIIGRLSCFHEYLKKILIPSITFMRPSNFNQWWVPTWRVSIYRFSFYSYTVCRCTFSTFHFSITKIIVRWYTCMTHVDSWVFTYSLFLLILW